MHYSSPLCGSSGAIRAPRWSWPSRWPASPRCCSKSTPAPPCFPISAGRLSPGPTSRAWPAESPCWRFGVPLFPVRNDASRRRRLYNFCMADIFIGYARRNRDTIEQLASALEAAGYTVWWDRNIIGGSEFSRDIERELDVANVAIIAWSADASDSPWVKDEAAFARDQGKLLPVLLDSGVPPMGFRQ